MWSSAGLDKVGGQRQIYVGGSGSGLTDIRTTCHGRQARRKSESIRDHTGRDMTAMTMSPCQKTFSRVGTNRRASRHVEPVRSELVDAGDRSGYICCRLNALKTSLTARQSPTGERCIFSVHRLCVGAVFVGRRCLFGSMAARLGWRMVLGAVQEAILRLRHQYETRQFGSFEAVKLYLWK